MKPYTADTNAGRTKARDDINRPATAKAQRKAARQQANKQAAEHDV